MRIVLSGSSSVGKSSLLQEIRSNGYDDNFVLIEEIVRTLMKKGIQINKGADDLSQRIILEEHYKNAIRYQDFISDRCAVDAFVYATWDYLNGNYTFEQHKFHESIFLSCLKHYQLHFFLPVEFELVKDGVRDEDKKYRDDIDNLFVQTYDRYKIPFVTLTGTTKERFKTFKRAMYSYRDIE